LSVCKQHKIENEQPKLAA